MCLPEDGKETHDTGCKPDQLRQVEQESHVSASASKEADHGLGQTKLGRSSQVNWRLMDSQLREFLWEVRRHV